MESSKADQSTQDIVPDTSDGQTYTVVTGIEAEEKFFDAIQALTGPLFQELSKTYRNGEDLDITLQAIQKVLTLTQTNTFDIDVQLGAALLLGGYLQDLLHKVIGW